MKMIGKILLYLIGFLGVIVLIGWLFIYLYNSGSDTPFKNVEIDSKAEWMLVCRNRLRRDDQGMVENVWMQEDPQIINHLKDKIKIQNNVNDFLYSNETAATKFLGNSMYLYRNKKLVASKHYPGYNFDFKSIEDTLISAQYERFITEDYNALLEQKKQLEQQTNVRILNFEQKEKYELHTVFYFPFGKRIKEKGSIKEDMARKLQDEFEIKPEQVYLNGGFTIANRDNSNIIDAIGFRLSFASLKDIEKMEAALKDTPYYLDKTITQHSYRLEYLIIKK